MNISISATTITRDRIKKALLDFLDQYMSDKKDFPELLRLTVPMPEINLLAWLKNQAVDQKIYWFDKKTGLEVAAVGVADMVAGAQVENYAAVIGRVMKYAGNENFDGKYYGGFSFYKDIAPDDIWADFGAYRFILPRFEIIRKDGVYTFVCNFIQPEVESVFAVARELEVLNFQEVSFNHETSKLSDFITRPDKTQWREMIRTALRHIRQAEYEKIVLAREIELQFLSHIDPFSLMSVLRERNSQTINFCIQNGKHQVFLGSTPEMLYRRTDREILSEAVAGTRPRGRNAAEDLALAMALQTSEKEVREHGFVAESLRRNLDRLTDKLESAGEVTVLKLARIQHLYLPFSGILKAGVTDGDILEALHPTPAVGGFPEKSILPILKETEPFNRGWYAAPIGWIGAGESAFSVAIRSALVTRNKIMLYSGAGIVEGSSPDNEWDELENKLFHFKRILGVDGQSLEKHQQLLGISSY
ncbi:MAG: isochorismate synthase [Calditrichales bacterium]|nr:MAG: isochorismate synthase [Calditrichales bacterium]